MFRDRVVAHYVQRGYTVEADKLVTGASGSPHRPDLICAGDLGDIVVYFGDDDPMAGPELVAIKRAAHDLGAAPVVAVPEASATVRDTARKERIVLLEAVDLDGGSETDDVFIESIEAEWPDPVVPPRQPDPVPEAAPVDVPSHRVGAFDWLGDEDDVDLVEEVGIAPPAEERTGIPLHWIWGPALYLAATLILVVIGAILLF